MEIKSLVFNRISQGIQKFLPKNAEHTTLEGAPELSVDTSQPMRLGYRFLGYGLGAFLLWAIFAPLNEGVPAHATVMLDTKRKTVQHQQGGIVREVLVKEGQMVKEGETLVRLDEANIRAQHEAVKQNYMVLRALEGRLISEQLGQDKITFHPDLLAAANEPFVKQHMDNQSSLLKARRTSLDAELKAMDESIDGQQAILKGYREILPHRQEQIRLLREELKGMRDLVKEGYAPRSKQSEMERQDAELNANLAQLQSNIAHTNNAISELRLRRIQRKQDYQKEVEGQLTEVRRQVDAEAEKLRAASAELARTDIKATTTGQVVGLAIQTVGGVVQPYQTLMDIVPKDEPLLLEIHVPPHLIDRVKLDDIVDVRFNSFAHSPQLVVEGKLTSISGDLLSDPRGQMPPYYLARAMVTPAGMESLGKRVMQAGMPAEVVIKTGERSMLTYLLHPLTKRIASSLTEE